MPTTASVPPINAPCLIEAMPPIDVPQEIAGDVAGIAGETMLPLEVEDLGSPPKSHTPSL